MKIMRAITIGLSLLLILAAAARAQGFVINLMFPDQTVLIYSVGGVKPAVGERLTILHAGAPAGVVEVVQDKGAFVVGRIVEQAGPILEGDPLTSGGAPGAAPAGSKVVSGDAKADKKEKKEEKKEKTDKKEKKTEKKDEDDSAKEKKETKKPKESKSEKKVAEAAPPEPAKKQPIMLHPPVARLEGFTGLFTVISAEKQVRHQGNASIAYANYGGDRLIGNQAGVLVKEPSILNAPMRGTKERYYALTYALDNQLELAVCSRNADLPAAFASYTQLLSVRATSIGLKYTAEKKYLFKGTTHKRVWYALGVYNTNYDYHMTPGNSSDEFDDDSDTTWFGAVTMKYQKLKWHFNVYHSTEAEVTTPWKRKWGSKAGIETPLGNRILLIGDADRFQGRYIYSLGARFYVDEHAALLLGFMDIDNTNQTLLSGTFMF